MAKSTFSGPLMSGTNRFNQYKNVGSPVLMQYWKYDIPGLLLTNMTNGLTTAMTTAAGVFSSALYIPALSIITNIYADADVVYNQGTSAAATVGIAAAGTDYVTTIDLKSATGRLNPTFTAAQLLAMNLTPATSGVTTPTLAEKPVSTLTLTITSVGTAASTGHGFIYVFYQQTQAAISGF